MFPSLWIPESLGKTKVDHIYVVLLFSYSDEEVIWLYVSVKEVARVNEFYSL